MTSIPETHELVEPNLISGFFSVADVERRQKHVVVGHGLAHGHVKGAHQRPQRLHDLLCGLVIGHNGYVVEFGVLAPTLFVPRFQFEHRDDTMQLDQQLQWGAMVNWNLFGDNPKHKINLVQALCCSSPNCTLEEVPWWQQQ